MMYYVLLYYCNPRDKIEQNIKSYYENSREILFYLLVYYA